MAETDRVIAQVTAALVSSDPRPEAILTAVVETLAKARQALWVGTLLSTDPTELQAVARAGQQMEIADFVNAMQAAGGLTSTPVSSRVIMSGEPLVVSKIPARDFLQRYLDETLLNQLDSRRFLTGITDISAVVVPMRSGGVTVGSLGMFLYDAPHPVGEEDLAWVQLAADQTALAVQNAQLTVDARRRLDQLEALRAVLDAIRSSQDLTVTLNIVSHRVMAILKVDACDVLLVDDTKDELLTSAASGFSPTPVTDFRLPVDNPLLRQALASRRVEDLRSAAVLDHAHRRSVFVREGFRSYAAVPLVLQGRSIGALEVFDRSELNPDAEWFQFLDSIAGMAAIAVEVTANERLFERTRVRKSSGGPTLSPIENQILRLLVEGQTNREIAAHIHLSQSTVKFHVRQILDKSGAANRTDLTRRATRESWV